MREIIGLDQIIVQNNYSLITSNIERWKTFFQKILFVTITVRYLTLWLWRHNIIFCFNVYGFFFFFNPRAVLLLLWLHTAQTMKTSFQFQHHTSGKNTEQTPSDMREILRTNNSVFPVNIFQFPWDKLKGRRLGDYFTAVRPSDQRER